MLQVHVQGHFTRSLCMWGRLVSWSPGDGDYSLVIKEAAQSRIPFLITGLGEGQLKWGTAALWTQQGNSCDSPKH